MGSKKDIIILVERYDGCSCPNDDCDGKLKYVGYTAFTCKTCKTGFSIDTTVIVRDGKPLVKRYQLSQDEYL